MSGTSGFWAWVAGPGGTLAGMSVALVVGTALGWLAHAAPRRVSRRERLELADAAADRAARQFRRMRQPELRERKTSTAAFLDPTPYGAVMFADVAPELAHEWEPAHVASALTVANGDPITTGEIRAITEDMDVFMERLLGEHPVPWPDGERSGQ